MDTKAIQKYEEQGVDLLSHAESIMIVDPTTRELAVEFTTKARGALKALELEFRPDIQKAHSLHRDLLGRLKTLSEPFKEAKRIVDGEISHDYLEQEKIREEEQRVADEKAEAERAAQEAELQADAEEAIEAGDLEEAEELLDTTIETAPVVPVAEAPKTVRSASGTTTVKKDIAVDLVDKAYVIEAVYDNTLPDTLLDVNMGAAKRYAKASGLAAGTLSMPGFHITETATVAGRAR